MAPSSSSNNNNNAASNTGNSKPVKAPQKSASHQGFGTNMPMMSSAFDTAMWSTTPV